MSDQKISVLIPCKNEELNIRACIESVHGLADEIIVADSGSTDLTLEIVEQLGQCRVIEREFVGYADFKNWAIPHATHPWVLILDADERMNPELAREIREKLPQTPEDVDGYWIGFNSYFMGHRLRYAGFNTRACRLIRRDRCRYLTLRVHEEINVPKSRTRVLNGKLCHFSYWSYDEYFQKYLKYTKLGAEDLWDRGKRATAMSLLARPFFRFISLYFLRGGFLDGIPGLQICIVTSFFNTFVKQARLWEMEQVRPPRLISDDGTTTTDPEDVSPPSETRRAA